MIDLIVGELGGIINEEGILTYISWAKQRNLIGLEYIRKLEIFS